MTDVNHSPRRGRGPAFLTSGGYYVAFAPQLQLAVIERVVEAAPEATERSYGLPAFRYRDKPLLWFAAHQHHLGLYPFSPASSSPSRTSSSASNTRRAP